MIRYQIQHDLEEVHGMKRALLAVLAIALLVMLRPLPSHAVPVISAPIVTVGVGDTFTIPILIAGAADLTFWQFDLAFNPAIVQANSVTEGPFMSAFGVTLFTPGVIDNTAGLISGVADFFIDIST